MNVSKTFIDGLLIVEPRIFKDERGYFFESYNENNFHNQNIKYKFVQDNQSKSAFGVLRGLHYQVEPYAQTKLIRVLQGKIYDVAVDIRQGSPTFGNYFGIELSDENFLQLLIPEGFAHGFSVLSSTAIILYKCDNFYNPQSERGIIYNDKELNIDWQIKPDKVIVSEKDKILPSLSETDFNFKYIKE